MEMPAKPGRVTVHMAAAACAALIAAASAGAQIFPQSAPRRVAAVPDSSFFRPPSAPDGPAIEPVAADAPESPPTDAPGEEGDLRLVGRVDVNGFATGALQVFHNGAYGAVCSNQFDSVDADVACRQLGFTGGAAIPLALASIQNSNTQRALIDSILAPMVLENLACTGTEDRLVDCPGSQDDDYGFDYTYTYYGINSAGCDPLQATYAFVACGTESGPEQGDVRLVGGMTSEDGNAQFGRLEIFSSGGWGTVCDRSGSNAGFFFGRNRNIAEFTEDSADVACKQLGFAEGSKTQLSRNTMSMEERRIPILVAGATCTGDEDSLTDCPGFGFGNNTDACGLTNNLIISCFNGPNAGKDGELRLVEGSSGAGYEYGRLEIFLRGFWSTICDAGGFTPDSAQVACKALGYDGGSSLEFRQEYSLNEVENQVLVVSLPVGLASVDCNGTEASLLNCTSSQRDLQQCGIVNTNFTDATVLACANTAASCNKDPPLEEGSVRLRGGFGTPCDPVHTGFVEVYHFEEWGAICTGADNSDLLVADVVCRQLGFPHGTVIDPRTNPADDESNDDPYGFGGYAYAPYEEEAEEEQERFWLNRASCQGPEQKLVDCDLGEGFRSNNGGCTSNPIRLTVACRTFAVEEALEEVTTPGAKDGDVRLVDQASVSNWEVGRLEIFFEGSWSQVCAAKFESADADVACRQLGYGAGSVGPNRANGAAATPDDRLVFPVVALTTVNCNGTESSLLECAPPEGMLRRSDSRDCFGVDGAGLTLACVAEPEAGEEGALRLTDGGDGAAAASGVGVLEIFHAGAWGTVCEGEVDFTGYGYLYGFEYGQSSTFSDSSAGIACRELGFEDGVFSAVSSIPDNVTLLPAWLGSLPCVGVEPTLAQCDGIEFGNTETCGLTQRLVCTSQATPDSSRGEARLTGGSADPGGAWAYGRLEVSDGEFFSSIREARFGENFGRRGAQVACRSLGFSSGAQITAASLSALPGPSGAVDTIDSIACQGNETSLADCDITAGNGYDYAYAAANDEDRAVALICSNPSDCSPSTSPPKQGDIRLVDFSGVISETAPCDPVHFGGVEFFNDGQWGRVCNGRFGDEPEDFIIDAKVICRQLGFPFGSLLDAGEVFGNSGPIGSADYGDYSDPGELVWATDVLCTGKEERLDQCFFPEDFGDSPRGAFGFAPAAAPEQDGVRSAGCRRRDSQLLGVVCRQFELTESDVIRRL